MSIVMDISPELMEAAAAYIEAVDRLTGRTQQTHADIKAILEQQFWTPTMAREDYWNDYWTAMEQPGWSIPDEE